MPNTNKPATRKSRFDVRSLLRFLSYSALHSGAGHRQSRTVGGHPIHSSCDARAIQRAGAYSFQPSGGLLPLAI